MLFAAISEDIVTNVVEADPQFAEEHGFVPLVGSAWIGWKYIDGVFSPPDRDLEAEWTAVRQKRNFLLTESDIFTLSDRWAALTPEEQTAWATYRQELRDIPQTYSDPADVVWPVEP